MGEISNENIAFIENQEKVTEKHPMSPESNLMLMALLAYWLSLFLMSNNRGDNVRLETFVCHGCQVISGHHALSVLVSY